MTSVAQLEQELIASYVTAATEALYLYDWIDTLSEEVNVIWRRNWTSITWLYALTRYSAVLDEILFLIPPWNFVSCVVLIRIDNILQLTQFLCFAWFSSLRVYALLGGKYFWSGIILLLNLVPFATNLVNFTTAAVVANSEICGQVPAGSDDPLSTMSLATRTAVIVGDVLVLVITWTKTAQAYREARRMKIRAPLATILFRDGTIYFIVLLVINILVVLEDNVPVLFTVEIASPFLDILTPIIICHFILSLRRSAPAESSLVSSSQAHTSSTLRFTGNMGQSLLVFGEDDDEEDDEGAVSVGFISVRVDGSPGDDIAAAEDTETDDDERRDFCIEIVDIQQGPSYIEI